MAYWKERQQRLYGQLEKDEARLNKKLVNYYKTQMANIENGVAAYFAKYGEDNVIQFKSLMLQLSDEDKRLLMEHMEEFAKKYPQYAHLMPVRESIYKLNRLEGLRVSMQIQLAELGAQEEDAVRQHLEKWAGESYTAAMAFGSSFNAVNMNIARAVVNAKWLEGRNFSGRIWDNKNKLLSYLHDEFRNGVIRGNNYDTIARGLRRRFDVGRKEAMRLVYTEGTFIMNESSAQALENYYSQYRYSAIKDSHTCDICGGMDGEVFAFKDREPGLNFPPMHPNCRCAFEVVVEGDNALHTYEDPMREKLGSAFNSNPKEVKKFIAELKDKNIEIEYRDNVMAYQPNPVPGKSGRFVIDKAASYSAWLHEMQHVYDDEAGGWYGLRILLNIKEFVELEDKAYDVEIEYAKNLGYNDVVERLENLKRQRRNELIKSEND